jgi:hypothetical protein
MSYILKRLRLLDRLDSLIKRKGTGDRTQLAQKLNVSIRTVTNLKCELELMGARIIFDRACNSYIYHNSSVRFNWNIVIDLDNSENIKGGQNFTFFSRRQNYCPLITDICNINQLIDPGYAENRDFEESR